MKKLDKATVDLSILNKRDENAIRRSVARSPGMGEDWR